MYKNYARKAMKHQSKLPCYYRVLCINIFYLITGCFNINNLNSLDKECLHIKPSFDGVHTDKIIESSIHDINFIMAQRIYF